jgi:pimeloyl-ACP methyl ester carboxylesterase
MQRAIRGRPVTSMTWENLTADAKALRESVGFDKWAVLGHSVGGKVALEYALRYPDSLSHLILLDTGGESRWEQENTPQLLAKRGFSRKKVELARRWFKQQTAPWEFYPTPSETSSRQTAQRVPRLRCRAQRCTRPAITGPAYPTH